MNILDIVSIGIIAILAIRCAFRGFITEIMSVAALILGILAAVFFSKAGAVVFDNYIGLSRWNQIIAFIVIFLIVYIVLKLLESIIHKILERIKLEKLDRMLGFILGLAEGAIVVILIVYLLRVQPIFDLNDLLDASFFAGLVLEIVPIFVPEAGTLQAAMNV
jgi:membrane protein required for colicin V production